MERIISLSVAHTVLLACASARFMMLLLALKQGRSLAMEVLPQPGTKVPNKARREDSFLGAFLFVVQTKDVLTRVFTLVPCWDMTYLNV